MANINNITTIKKWTQYILREFYYRLVSTMFKSIVCLPISANMRHDLFNLHHHHFSVVLHCDHSWKLSCDLADDILNRCIFWLVWWMLNDLKKVWCWSTFNSLIDKSSHVGVEVVPHEDAIIIKATRSREVFKGSADCITKVCKCHLVCSIVRLYQEPASWFLDAAVNIIWQGGIARLDGNNCGGLYIFSVMSQLSYPDRNMRASILWRSLLQGNVKLINVTKSVMFDAIDSQWRPLGEKQLEFELVIDRHKSLMCLPWCAFLCEFELLALFIDCPATVMATTISVNECSDFICISVRIDEVVHDHEHPVSSCQNFPLLIPCHFIWMQLNSPSFQWATRCPHQLCCSIDTHLLSKLECFLPFACT